MTNPYGGGPGQWGPQYGGPQQYGQPPQQPAAPHGNPGAVRPQQYPSHGQPPQQPPQQQPPQQPPPPPQQPPPQQPPPQQPQYGQQPYPPQQGYRQQGYPQQPQQPWYPQQQQQQQQPQQGGGAPFGRPPKQGNGRIWAVVGGCVVVIAVLAVLLFAWPGWLNTKVFDQGKMEQDIKNVLQQQYKIGVQGDVRCPSGEQVEQGNTFNCEVSVNGESRQVTVTVKDEDSASYEVSQPK